MEKTKFNKNSKYPLCRIPKNQFDKLKEVGTGHWRQGLTKVLENYERFERDPKKLVLAEWDHFCTIFKACLSDNHYQHFDESELSAVMFRLIKTGNVDYSLVLNKRKETPLEMFKEESTE